MSGPTESGEWEEVSDYCITNGKYNITRSGSGKYRRFTLWDLSADPLDPRAKVGIYRSAQAARKAARDGD